MSNAVHNCVSPENVKLFPFFLVPAPSFTPSLRAWRLGENLLIPFLLLAGDEG